MASSLLELAFRSSVLSFWAQRTVKFPGNSLDTGWFEYKSDGGLKQYLQKHTKGVAPAGLAKSVELLKLLWHQGWVASREAVSVSDSKANKLGLLGL
jgi:hypothetical protein